MNSQLANGARTRPPEQAPQSVFSVLTMQLSLMNFACPSCVSFFSSPGSGRRAPLGQTWPQAVQSKLQ